MKILIAADMEGISGVVHSEQVTPGQPEYERFRRIMTADVNAVLRGAVQAGADEIVVVDGHWNGRNILIEELDPRARLISGLTSPYAMLQGLDGDVSGVMFIGYHARCGSLNAILDHTWSSTQVANLWLNGKPMGEIGLNAALCGHFNVPVILVSGDQTACAEAGEVLGQVELVVVKRANGRLSAECLPLELSHQKLRDMAARAISRLRADDFAQPFKLQAPILVAIEFMASDMADRAVMLPGLTRIDGKRIQFTVPDMLMAYRMFRTAVALSHS